MLNGNPIDMAELGAKSRQVALPQLLQEMPKAFQYCIDLTTGFAANSSIRQKHNIK